MIENIHPVLLLENNRRIRLFQIAFEKDGSIYFIFPRKNSYSVSNASAVNYSLNNCTRPVKIHSLKMDYTDPKISFHPKEYTVHIKARNNQLILEDYKLFNFYKDETNFVCPLIQIVFPNNFNQYDDYAKAKYAHSLEIKKPDNFKGLSIYIFIHSQNIEISTDALQRIIPNSDVGSSVYKSIKFQSNAKYTCTLQLINKDFNNDTSMLVMLNTKDQFVNYRFDFL